MPNESCTTTTDRTDAMTQSESTFERAIRRIPHGPFAIRAYILIAAGLFSTLLFGPDGWWVGPLIYLMMLAVLWGWRHRHVVPPEVVQQAKEAPRLAAGVATGVLGAFLCGVRRRLLDLVSEPVLPYTLLNVVLLVLIACMVWSIDIAFWLALAAVPVVLILLIVMSLNGAMEPQEDEAE